MKKNVLRTIVCIAIILILTASYICYSDEGKKDANLSSGSIYLDNIERNYLVYMPSKLNNKKKPPMVLCLHGFGQSAQKVIEMTGGKLNELAQRDGVVVVYPNAIANHWNDKMGGVYKATDDVDDVGFISALIDKCKKKYNIDSNRIYVMGLSNGGGMTYRLSCEIPEKLKAIAPVISSMGVKSAKEYKKAKPLPILIMNGTSDPIVPWKGGEVNIDGNVMPILLSCDDNVLYWINRNGASKKAEVKNLPHINKKDKSHIITETYKSDNGNDVILYKVVGGGHTLPSLSPTSSNPDNPQNMDIDGSEVIWNFFMSH